MLTTRTMIYRGKLRKYLLFTPSKMPTYTPLVFVFHGNTSNGNSVMWESKFNEVAEKNGFAVVYPYGLPISDRFIDRTRCCWNDGRPFIDGTPYDAPDLTFIREIFEDIKAVQFRVDLTRVFSAGYSNGGHFSLRLSQEFSWIRAAASLAGQRGPNDWMTAKYPKSVLLINGTQDGFAPFNGGLVPMQTIFDQHAKPVVDSYVGWCNYNKCDIPALDTTVGNARTIQRRNAAGLVTRLIVVNGMGHVWPGGNVESPYLGPEDNSVLGSEEMWKFFKEVSQ